MHKSPYNNLKMTGPFILTIQKHNIGWTKIVLVFLKIAVYLKNRFHY